MTDNYILCENAVISDIKNLGQYFPNDWQVSRDDSVLSRGADYFAIFKPGAGGNQAAWSTIDLQVEWIVLINVYARWKSNIDETLKRISECTDTIREISIRDSFLEHIPGVMTSSCLVGELQYVYPDDSPTPMFLMKQVSLSVFQMTERQL